MQVVLVERPGGYERLRIVARPDVPPGAGEVAIDVTAVGVNYADCVVRMGLYESAKKYVGYPIVPGFEVAGRVSAVGAGVHDLAVGDAVLAVTRFGGYATRLVVPRAYVFRRPAGFTDAQAAAFPSVHLTAWWALCELAHPRPGARVLVHSAAGGVGQAAVGIAHILGCEVTGVVGRAAKLEAAKRAGAKHVIETRALWKGAEALAPEGFDVILDANGPSTLRASYAHLAPGGRLVVYGFHTMLPKTGGVPRLAQLALGWLRVPRFDPLRMTGENRSVLAFNLSYLFERTDLLALAMDALLGWVREGRLAPPETHELPFDSVADAHRALESGTTTGKLVLRVRADEA